MNISLFPIDVIAHSWLSLCLFILFFSSTRPPYPVLSIISAGCYFETRVRSFLNIFNGSVLIHSPLYIIIIAILIFSIILLSPYHSTLSSIVGIDPMPIHSYHFYVPFLLSLSTTPLSIIIIYIISNPSVNHVIWPVTDLHDLNNLNICLLFHLFIIVLPFLCPISKFKLIFTSNVFIIMLIIELL